MKITIATLLMSSLLLCFRSISQTTEDFETETVGTTSFTDNGQIFDITNGSGETTYDIETFTSGGWNGSGPDDKFIDNSSGSPMIGDGSSFSISTNNGTDIYVNSFYLFVSNRFISGPGTPTTLTVTGIENGAIMFTVTKTSGIVDGSSFTPNNGFTYVDLSTEGGNDNSTTAIDELQISTTNNADYLALDALNWQYAPVCTSPSEPTVTHNPATVCNGETALLNISGILNDATDWQIYTGSCGGTNIGSTTTGTFSIPGTINTPTTYFVRGEGGCVTSGSCGSITITPQALDNASFVYNAASYCVNDVDPTPTVTGLSGGTFSSSAGLAINAGSGAIDVSASTPGTYTVTYTTSGNCPNSSNVLVTINPLDDASFSYGAASYCSSDADPTSTITGLGGGTFSSTAGLSINATSGLIDVSTSTPGTYTVTYTTTGTCPNSSNEAVTINATDDASFSYSSSLFCPNDTDPTPTISGINGGAFTSSPSGLSLNGSTGQIDLSSSSQNSYSVTYTTAGTCPNNSTVTVAVEDNTAPVADNASLTTLTEECEVTSLIPPIATDNCVGTVTGTTTATLPISASTTITWTYDDGNGNTSTQTQDVVINDATAPVADNASLTTLTDECEIATLTAPTATDNCVGTITGTPNAILPIFASTTITWTYDDGNGNTSTQTQDVVIDDITAPVADNASLTTLTEECEVTSLIPPVATDNCVGTVTGTTTATLPISASTTITWTYDDGNGNTSTQTQDVVINDATAPVADNASLTTLTDVCEVVTLTAPTATDNCIGTVTATTTATLPISASTTITWTYDDGNGNTSTQTQDVVITPIDNGATQVDPITLSADASGYDYQWVDCNDGNAPITGETNQTFVAADNGSYAVEVSNGTCSVTSDCIVVDELGLYGNEASQISVYPNPTENFITVEAGNQIESITILNSLGQTFKIIENVKPLKIEISLPEQTGVYLIQVNTERATKTIRVVKK